MRAEDSVRDYHTYTPYRLALGVLSITAIQDPSIMRHSIHPYAQGTAV